MIATLARHDLKLLAREGSALWVVLILLTATAYAVYSGSTWKRDLANELEVAAAQAVASVADERAKLSGLETGELPISAAAAAGLPHVVSTEFILPPGPVAELSVGDADLRPSKAKVAAVGRSSDVFRFYQVDNPALLALGRFDLSFVVVYLLPLLILAVTYSVLSSDRESGSLQLLLSQPVSAGKVAATRIGVRVVLVVALTIVFGITAWLVFSPGAASVDAWPRCAMWMGVVALYGLFWGALVALVVARNGASDSNALVLLLAWATTTLLIPAIIMLVTDVLSPAPSRLEFITTAREAENAANSQGQELLQGYLLDHPEIEATEQSAVAPFIKTFVLVQQRVEEAVAPLSQRFDRQLDSQQALARSLSFLSPASLAQRSLAGIAGSDLERHRRYQATVRSLRARWLSELEGPLIAGRRLTLAEFDALERPEFQEPSTASVAGAVVAPVAALSVYALVLLFWARGRFARFVPVTSRA